ncbi:hypothetical protein [Pseudonocardia alni]|uniref:Uncharacterized protein n=1 Tax=Pseudonocardia alni subsp. carboxydivorans TaxID=415010 RepID=A0ABU9AE77_PSEA5
MGRASPAAPSGALPGSSGTPARVRRDPARPRRDPARPRRDHRRVPAATTADPTASRPSISTPMLSGQPASRLVY